MDKLKTIVFLLLSMHMPLHQQARGDDSLTYSHRLLPQSGVGGFLNQGVLAAKRTVCRRTHSRDSPSDRHGTRLSDNLHQRACCERQGQALYQWFYLRPDFWEYWGFLGVFATEPVNLATPVVIIVRLWLDERVERIHNLTITYNDYANGANRTALVVCRFKIYCCKISHYLSSLYLFHILFILPAISLRSQRGSSTSMSSPFQRISCMKSNVGRR